MNQFIFTLMIFFLVSGLKMYGQQVVETTLIIDNEETAILVEFEDDIFDTNDNPISINCTQIEQLSLDICIELENPDEDQPCILVYDPVCGCNDITYSNACFAIKAGILSWSTGECDNDKPDPHNQGLAKARKRKKIGDRALGEIIECDGYELELSWAIVNESETDSVIITKIFCINQLCGDVCLPGKLFLFDEILSSNIYRAESVVSNAIVQSNKNVVFKGEESITLLPNFHAKSGSDFTATIESCSPLILENQREYMSQINQDKKIAINGLSLDVYPNPIKNQSTIKFGLPKDVPIELSIYTLQGQRIQQISQNSVYNKGQHQIEWNPSDLSQGMYLISLKTDDQEIVRKIIIQ